MTLDIQQPSLTPPPVECRIAIWERRLVSRGDWRRIPFAGCLERKTIYDFNGLKVEQFEIWDAAWGGIGEYLRQRLEVVWRVRDTGPDNTVSVSLTFWPETWNKSFERRCIHALQALFAKMVTL
jgi:hypothetical protein